ncbi:VWA domain-containing protein [Chengkuizengella axinellae]|uniref:VWA domain-containing protein n=1 Tax=Chengkuizengella axinellae TaxID=3064388 RepID=A0ABT9IUW0_9BACL|nr:VWA domain-containing protein [Chengkuizengella sp. 2205SS18-9]MDP5273125.1 VWA domain-containing protein [Chengkuizengella sp. 2205SS18-9]
MGLRFDSPWFLMLLVPFIILFYLSWKRDIRLTGYRKKMAYSLRILFVGLLIFALAGMQWYSTIKQNEVIFVIDRSDSMNQISQITDWIKEAGLSKKENDKIGVVSIGLDAVVERSLNEANLKSLSLNSKMQSHFTNIEEGLQLAESLFSNESTSRIVLVSDGLENVGDMVREARILKNNNIPVDVLEIQNNTIKDVSIDEIHVSEHLYQGEKFSLEVTVNSTIATSGILRIFEDNQEISNQQVQIEAGENIFALQSMTQETGLHQYKAEIYAQDDEQNENNIGFGLSRVVGPAKVLLVEGVENSSQNITSVLDSSFIPYEILPPELLPSEPVDYTAYESIIFNNVSATQLSERKMEIIEQMVRDYGIGFMMIGGKDSYGLGGYFKTPIERTLPVYMDLRGKRQIPSLGLMLVIDKSGSMNGDKIRLAQEAAIRTVELMRDQDSIGVVAFDGSPWWVVEPQKLTERETIVDQISSIQANGGTEIYTAVQEAYSKLVELEAQRKHIILLTDGHSSSSQSYEMLTSQMTEHDITLSSVGIGDGADQAFLEYIAELANGRFYYTQDQSTIPAIFSREAVLMSRTYIVDQPFAPAFGQGADWYNLFSQGVPQIQAYIATTPKETAEVVLMSPEPDPLLARWQYGAGKSVAWTSDFTGEWSNQWINWNQFPEVLSNVVKWTFPQFETTAFTINSSMQGNKVELNIESTTDFKGMLQGSFTDESLQNKQFAVTPTVPGEYFSQIEIKEPGVYLTRFDMYEENQVNSSSEIMGSVTTGFVVPYSPEYEITNIDTEHKLNQLMELTQGRTLSMERPEEVFQFENDPSKKFYDISHYLIIAALILWLLDIAVRRLSIPWFKWIAVLYPKTSKVRSNPSQETLEKLQRKNLILKKKMQSESSILKQSKLKNFSTSMKTQDHKIRSDEETRTKIEFETNKRDREGEQKKVDKVNEVEAEGNQTFNRLLAAKNRKKK